MAFPVDPVADIRAIRLPLGVALLEQRAQLRDDRSFPGFIVLRLAFPQANDGAEKINLAPIESENLAFAHARVKADRDGQLQIVRQYGHELVVLVAFEKSFSCSGLFRHGEVWDVPKLAIFRSEVKHTAQVAGPQPQPPCHGLLDLYVPRLAVRRQVARRVIAVHQRKSFTGHGLGQAPEEPGPIQNHAAWAIRRDDLLGAAGKRENIQRDAIVIDSEATPQNRRAAAERSPRYAGTRCDALGMRRRLVFQSRSEIEGEPGRGHPMVLSID